MPLINCKVELSLSRDPNCVLTSLAGALNFTITDAKFYLPIVTLSIEDNAKFSKMLSEGFKRPVYWNKYNVTSNRTYNQNNHIRELPDWSYKGVKRLLVLAYDNTDDNRVTADSHRRYFLPGVKVENYNIETDRRNFYDQSTNDLIKQYDEVRKVPTGQGDDYATGCLLDFACFEKKKKISCGWFKQTKSFRCWSKSNSTDYFYW